MGLVNSTTKITAIVHTRDDLSDFKTRTIRIVTDVKF